MMFFSYCPECGFETYGDEQSAKAGAQHHLDHFTDEAWEGWSDETDNVCWGKVIGNAVPGPEMTGCEFFECGDDCDGEHEFDVYLRYELKKDGE